MGNSKQKPSLSRVWYLPESTQSPQFRSEENLFLFLHLLILANFLYKMRPQRNMVAAFIKINNQSKTMNTTIMISSRGVS